VAVYIFDLDGTLANIDHRKHYVESKDKDWNSFYKACVNDTINQDVVRLWDHLEVQQNRLFIFSGRSDIVKDETDVWLYTNGIIPNDILMRADGDYTPDDELKRGWLYKLIAHGEFSKDEIQGVFDDRNKVVQMWRNEGLTCFQVAKGDF